MNDLKHEMTNERVTSKLRWKKPGDDLPAILQQEYEITIHRYNDDSSHTQETKKMEWRDVPCE